MHFGVGLHADVMVRQVVDYEELDKSLAGLTGAECGADRYEELLRKAYFRSASHQYFMMKT